jgi:hypothetical protein
MFHPVLHNLIIHTQLTMQKERGQLESTESVKVFNKTIVNKVALEGIALETHKVFTSEEGCKDSQGVHRGGVAGGGDCGVQGGDKGKHGLLYSFVEILCK